MSFIGLHNHTAEGSNHRLRDSINKIPDIIEYAHSLGHKGVAFTEHESITSSFNALKYYETVKNKEGWEDFKVVLGNEIYLCTEDVTPDNKKNNRYPHFILLALNANGHKCIRELSSLAWSHCFKDVMNRVPLYYSELEEQMKKYKGDVVGSTACLGGALPYRFLQFREFEQNNSLEYQDIWQSCVDWVEYMNDIFGKGYFYLELQPSDNEEQIYVNQKLIELSKETKTPYIITTDSHYLTKEDRYIHKIYLSSQDGEREVDDFYATTYVMSEQEIHEYMDESLGQEAVQIGIDNTMLIYNMVEMYTLTKPLHIPYIPRNTDEPDVELYNQFKDKINLLSYFYESEYPCDRHLVREIVKNIQNDEIYCSDKGYAAIDECLSAIKITSEKMNVRWSAYLLQISDFVKIAWEAGTLVGAGRGSGVGFCLLHILGITQINPLRETTRTYPWRFLNPERASVLDIDIDIESSKREVVVEALQREYGADRVSKVMTLTTETPKSAILTVARGMNINNDAAQYIASMIISDRGTSRTLRQMYYGDSEEGFEPVTEFINEINKHEGLFENALKIEGLVCGVGSHAGGIILVDEPFTNTTAQMKTNTGDIITQFDLHVCEECSLIKVDLLSIDALDRMHSCLDLFVTDKQIEPQKTLKDTYEKYIGIYTLEREKRDMWKMLWEHKVVSFFQMEKDSGIQAIALAQPKSVDELATINSVMRLMAQEKGGEQPLDKFARFKKDINEWYNEMSNYGLTQEEQDILKDIIGISSGICEAQEYLVLLTQHPKIGGFSLSWGDRLRKAVAKKMPKDFIQLEKEFFANAKEKKLSPTLVNYVWNVLISTQRGYGFNKSHTLSYSLIGLQELNLNYKYNPIYWQTANLIVESGAMDENANDASNYGKTAVAIALSQKNGVRVTLPLINEANYGFKPDITNNRIIFGLKGINGINNEISQLIIENRPYASIQDFATKLLDTNLIKPTQMVQLIKAGCFTELHYKDKSKTMDWYLRNYKYEPCSKLTMSQYNNICNFNIIPENLKLCQRMIGFKGYVLDDAFLVEKHIKPNKKMVKRGYHDGYYTLDDNSQPFFTEHFTEDSIVEVKNGYYIVSEKLFTKEVDKYIQPLKDWLASDEALTLYNNSLYEELWEKYASGTQAAWSMKALNYYDAEHELDNINEEMYGIKNFFEMPETPEAYDYYSRYIGGEVKQLPKYNITRIAGTVINFDNAHHTIHLLTKYGCVPVKFSKGAYAHYNKRISVKNDENSDKKTVLENSWFSRGTKLIITGVRYEQNFKPMRYADTVYLHTVNRIEGVYDNGTMLITSERVKV